MRFDQVRFIKERNRISTFVRNTSCNSGWLRLLVQIIFGILIASSFILIMLMVLGKSGRNQTPSRCSVFNCRIICNNAPLYGDFEDDIINAALEAETVCESIILKLIQPTFKNFEIPENWLSRMRSNIRELTIVGGNAKYIAPHAFMSPFTNNIRALIFEEIEITVWENDMLAGLSRLRELILRDCLLHHIRKGALSPVDDSLELLEIKASKTWDPANVTGSVRLLELNLVDFSSNNFRNTLRNESFSKLIACKVLYLNSCQIVSLESGTFDHLESIDVLYLNDNFLVTLPVGLFDRILPQRPKIALQENPWFCDCSVDDLRVLVRNDLLVVDPICHSPESVALMTFSDFEGYCISSYLNNLRISDELSTFKSTPNFNYNASSEIIYANGACYSNNSLRVNLLSNDSSIRVIAPSEHQRCLLNRINILDIQSTVYKTNKDLTSVDSNWIKPAFFVQNNPYSMVEIMSSTLPGYGLLWYQSSCTNTVYCVNTVPNILKVFNVHLGYITFCPFNLSSGEIKSFQCVSHNLAHLEGNSRNTLFYHEIVLYICISLVGLMFGAACVYCLIQRKPSLLKGSKRVLLVKHRSIEALILPPKLPMRTIFEESRTESKHIYEKKKVFVLPNKLDPLKYKNFDRSISMKSTISMKSNDSNEASYISALQPTEEQLREWRSNQIVKQFNNTPASDFSVLPYSNIYERESLPYYSFHSDERIYEVPKQY